jgi:hypothetical protein
LGGDTVRPPNQENTIMMNRIKTAAATLLSLIVVCAMNTASPVSAQDYLIYQGTATLTVGLVDVYGQFLGQQSYTTNVEAYVKAAEPRGSNPFELVVQSVPLVNAPGEVSLWSSATTAPDVLFQYWTYQYDPASGTLVGSLTNNHVAEAIALNLLTIPVEIAPHLSMPSTLAMANGTQMNGHLDDNQLQLQVLGNTTDQAHPFELAITANRVN